MSKRPRRGGQLSHVDSQGRIKMVDVGDKPITAREAVAHGSIRMSAEARRLIRSGRIKKGDPLQAARLAGIMAAKQTSALIPLCHPLPISSVEVNLLPTARGYHIEARVKTTAQTGVEMEALTAVAVAALTIYDMVKAVDKTMVIGDVQLMMKSGGRSGLYRADRRSTNQDPRIQKRNAEAASGAAQRFGELLHPKILNAMIILVGVISPAPIWVLPKSFVDRLRADFPHHSFLEAWDREAIRRQLPDADVAFTPFIDRDVFPSAARLRWIQSPAVGVGSLMFPELLASPVVVTSARGIRARSIAEHVIGVTIALARRLPLALRAQQAHHWAQGELEGPQSGVRALDGMRMGIVGLGSIGMEIVKRAAPFGIRVSAIRRRPQNPPPPGVDHVFAPDRLAEVLESSDIVVLAVPHTPETKQIIGAHELERMKPGAILINIARGKLIDDEAVVQALRSGKLGGAALDVFTREPLEPESPYWDLPNVIVTPHTSGAMQDYWTPLVQLFADNLRRFERGEPLLNVVDKVAGY